MAGKSYTMREMKSIVDHLVNTRAYSEIKGRKMWMDFSNSKLTNRTWQSLKETFLKRILPDIHNPYYQLTVEQINSFRAGYDVKAKNRLDVVQVDSDSSTTNENNNKGTETCNTNDIKQVNNAGENTISTENTQNRSPPSNPCYNIAEPVEDNTTSKSLRDCISYSEPLTPMLQEVLDDFASEPESDEDNALQIDERNSNGNTDNAEVSTNGETVPEHDTELGNVSTEVLPEQSEEQTVGTHVAEPVEETISPNTINDKENAPSQQQESTNYFTAENTEQVLTAEGSQNVAPLSKEVTQSNSTPDASLPNNQEGLNKHVENNESSQTLQKHSEECANTNKPDETTTISLQVPAQQPSKAPDSDDNKTCDTEIPTCNDTEQNNGEQTPTVSDTEGVDKRQSAETTNPCLQNVSLFDNQLNGLTYDSSDLSSNEHASGGPASTAHKDSRVVELRSHSDSDTEEVLQLPRDSRAAPARRDTDRILANVFGFSCGGVGSRRKKNISSRSRNFSKNNIPHASGSSSDSAHVSAPRARRGSSNRKYLRPQSAKILCLEEEGGLFVMYGKKLFPLVRDGELLKSYVSYSPDGNEICSKPQTKPEEAPVVQPEQIKVTLTKNNAKVLIEGNGSQIKSVLEQVMSIFDTQREPETVPDKCNTTPQSHTAAQSKTAQSNTAQSNTPQSNTAAPSKTAQSSTAQSNTAQSNTAQRKESSRESTPVVVAPAVVDVDVHNRVDKIEEEIMKEIQEKDAAEQLSNVTKRRGRPPIVSSGSPAKRAKLALKQKEDSSSKRSASDARNTRTSQRNSAKESSKVKQSKTKHAQSNTDLKEATEDSQEEVRYMFPTQLTTKRNRNKRKSLTTLPTIPSSEDIAIDSTQGYEDSDVSPVIERRKRKSLSTAMRRTRRSSKRISAHMYYDASNDSDNSIGAPPQKLSKDRCMLNTDVDRSKSHQLSIPVQHWSRHLAPLGETDHMHDEVEFDDNLPSDKHSADSNNMNSGPPTSVLGSPTVSLPLSPELSVIDNLSLSRDLLERVTDYPTLNETQANDVARPGAGCSKYMISDVDVSMPLMQQDCELDRCVETSTSHDPKSIVTESLIRKIGTFDLEDKVPATDRLDEKLRDLLLESAKKMDVCNTDNMMSIDASMAPVAKKAVSKKICSTPQRKKAPKSKKVLVPNVEAVVEEHVEYSTLARRSRRSVIETLEPVNEEIANLSLEKPKRKKKDIIKVKIVRPKKSRRSVESTRTTSVLSVSTESESIPAELHDSVGLIHNHSETCLFGNECAHTSFAQMQHGDAQDIASHTSCDERDVQLVRTGSSEDIVDSTGTVQEQRSCDTSLITEDLTDDEPPPPLPAQWFLLSEDENTNVAPKHLPKNVEIYNNQGSGSDLNQIIPVTAGISDPSTIAEMCGAADDKTKTLSLQN